MNGAEVISDGTVITHEHFKGRSPDQDLKHGGGGGTFDPMEQRVSNLEQAVMRIDDNVAAIRASQIRIEERMERVMDRARDMPDPDSRRRDDHF